MEEVCKFVGDIDSLLDKGWTFDEIAFLMEMPVEYIEMVADVIDEYYYHIDMKKDVWSDISENVRESRV